MVTAEFDYTYKIVHGAIGQYARCRLRIDPNPDGGIVFRNECRSDKVPERFVVAIEQGVRESLAQGVTPGNPIVDVAVTLVGGAYDEKDSSEVTFRLCGAICVKEAARKAGLAPAVLPNRP